MQTAKSMRTPQEQRSTRFSRAALGIAAAALSCRFAGAAGTAQTRGNRQTRHFFGGGGDKPKSSAESIYDFTVKDIDGNDVSLDRYKGKVCLIVNVASK